MFLGSWQKIPGISKLFFIVFIPRLTNFIKPGKHCSDPGILAGLIFHYISCPTGTLCT